MKDLKILLDKHNNAEFNNEYKFACVSGDIWEIGTLEEIKEKVSTEVFTFHIGVNMIGNWKNDGWDYIFVGGRKLLPYISETLEKLELWELKNHFDSIISSLKSYFENIGIGFLHFEKPLDEETHYDVMNFLINPRFKLKNETLNMISKEDRELMSKKYHIEIRKLDDISLNIWGYGADEEGWKDIINYVKKLK